MKVLIYLAGVHLGCSNGQHLDKAINEVKKGNEVFILNCDNSIGLCIDNPGHNPLYCRMCVHYQKADMKAFMPKGVERHWIHEFVNSIDEKDIPTFKYNTAKELRALNFHGVDVGLGAMSSYISLTRNLNPQIDDESRSYFDALLREQVITTLVLEKLQEEYHFDVVIFQNGRGAQFKPFLNFCQTRKIDFLCTEDMRLPYNYENNFWCDTPHSISAYTQLYQKCWDTSKDDAEKREQLARSFFEKRRNAVFSGDKIYTKDQVTGLMPEDWQNNVENIVIFNSSEDEFAAVSHEFDKLAFFPSQLEGLKTILEHYKEDKSKHFTLRVHPNLMNIPYKYHQDLYHLGYKNLTVIPASSPISTYSLMDAADKIIVFGSTTGIESVYWGKPVICLAAAFYRDFGIVYHPERLDELWEMIDTYELPCLYNDKVLTYGYFYMGGNHQRTKYVNIDIYNKKFWGKHLTCFKYQKLFKSNFLYALVTTIVERYLRMNFPAKYRKLPQKEA